MRRPLVRPLSLKPGDRVAIYSPALPGPALFPTRLARGVAALRSLGLDVEIPSAATLQTGYTAGSGRARAHELNRLFADDSVNAILCSIGGFNSTDILPYIDFGKIHESPKAFIGYSDVSALLLAIYAKTGMVTFHGPALLPEFGEFPEPFEETIQSWASAVGLRDATYTFAQPKRWTNEFLDWSKALDCRPRSLVESHGWRPLRAGHAVGVLVGGNIETINAIIGTEYLPELDGALLFLEATDSEAYLPRLQRSLVQLRQSGILTSVSGLVIGRCPDATECFGQKLEDVVLRVCEGTAMPIAMDVDFGHSDPKLTLPIGVAAKLDCDFNRVELSLLEDAVLRP